MSKSTWIILDDDADVQEIMSGMGVIWEIDLIELHDGHEAMSWAIRFLNGQYLGPPPELALLDIRLPGPQGHEVARKLRQIPELQDMAIVLMTAYSLSQQEQEQVMEIAQADLFLQKPLPRLFEFNRLMQQAIETRKAKR